MMLWYRLKKIFAGACIFLIYSLVLVSNAPAPPPPPPPPAAPVGGDIAQAIAMGAIAVGGAWRLWKRKK